MNFFEQVLEILKADERFFAEDGTLLRNAVYEAAMKMDGGLIKLLLEHEATRNRFFKKVEGVYVFDKVGFGWVINNREFLPDSFTRYKNKIGLTVGGSYLASSGDVELVFPYKDCVLEGGQTKEEQKRNEIFYNTLLAPDEVDRLLSPKVFTNAKRYTAKGVEEGTPAFDVCEDLVIKGNNLLCIASLLGRFEGAIKMVYIDPPYNTGGAANTFSYNNSFNHSAWLTFMKNRLEIARRLLTSDGSICIAIDDEEYAHLKILCDEIFGRENYIGTIVVQSNPRGRTIHSHFATCHEYSLFYAKNIRLVSVRNQPLTEEQEGDFGREDDEGQYRLLPFRRSGGTSTPEERPNSEFALYYSPTENNIVAVGGERVGDHTCPYTPQQILRLDEEGRVESLSPEAFFEEEPDAVAILPVDIYGKRRVWRWSDRKAILRGAREHDFVVSQKDGKYIVQLKDRIKDGRKPKTIWSDSKYDASANGTMLLKKMFGGEKPFSYPKSLHTVKDCIQMFTDPCGGDIVLDFFGGSGTTAHAVVELNRQDGGDRQFILCEQMDYIQTVTVPRLQKILSEHDTFLYCELAKSNQNFVERLETAEEDDLPSLWEDMQKTGFLSSRIALKEIDPQSDDFRALSLEEKKRLLMELLDLNQLYINDCDIDDETFGVSDADKAFTKSFYGEK